MSERSARVRTIVITAVLTALIVGGGVYWWQHARVRSLEAEIESLDGVLYHAEADVHASDLARTSQVQPLERRVRDLQARVEKLQGYRAEGKIPPDLLTVYTAAYDAPEDPVADYYLAVRPNLPVIEKLRIVAAKLSRIRFAELPINVVQIENVKGTQVAVIDLRELHHDIRLTMWRTTYFQGSTGGAVTQATLWYTFLQKGYRSEWVDGVRFLYEGKPMQEVEWDHINLSGIIYR